jgi:hypothetical protein
MPSRAPRKNHYASRNNGRSAGRCTYTFCNPCQPEAGHGKTKIPARFIFRISTFSLQRPSLRDRLDETDILAPFFVDKFLTENGFPAKELSNEALGKLKINLGRKLHEHGLTWGAEEN